MRRLFAESRGRIQAIGLIHEALFQGGDAATVDFGRYAQTLTSTLFRAQGPDSKNIALSFSTQSVDLGADKAVTCGLILNELVTNALKHAFPDSRPGVIFVAVCGLEGDGVELRVGDDGVGLERSADSRGATSLGLTLVDGLVRQLDGTLSVSTGNGTTFTLTFCGASTPTSRSGPSRQAASSFSH